MSEFDNLLKMMSTKDKANTIGRLIGAVAKNEDVAPGSARDPEADRERVAKAVGVPMSLLPATGIERTTLPVSEHDQNAAPSPLQLQRGPESNKAGAPLSAQDQQQGTRTPEEYTVQFREALDKSLNQKAPKTERTTWDEYGNLNRLQKAAVEFNTMLQRSRHEDHRVDEYSDSTGAYDNSYTQVFGDTAHEIATDKDPNDGRYYAPNTLALLEQVGFKNDSARVSDFTTGRALITTDDLKTWLTKDETGHLRDASSDPRGQIVQQLAKGVSKLQQKIEEGNRMLASFQQTAETTRTQAVTDFGGKPAVDLKQADRLEQQFAIWYRSLQDSKTMQTAIDNTPKFFDSLKQFGATADDFYNYAGNRAAIDTKNGKSDVMQILNQTVGLRDRTAP